MHIHDVARRVKLLLNRECALTRRETSLAKDSAKYHDTVEKLYMQIHKQQKELNGRSKQKEKLREQNERLERFVQEKEEHLQQTKQSVEQLRKEEQRQLTEQVQQRKRTIQQMAKMHALKQATNTFINLRALPGMVQGATLSEKQHSTECLPFSIAPMRHTLEQTQDHIWTNSRSASQLREEWENLFFARQTQSKAETMGMLTQNIQ